MGFRRLGSNQNPRCAKSIFDTQEQRLNNFKVSTYYPHVINCVLITKKSGKPEGWGVSLHGFKIPWQKRDKQAEKEKPLRRPHF